MRVLVLGGDGYLGWATAMNLAAQGHDVAVADNYLRRRNCRDLDCQPLVGVPEMPERAAIWRAAGGRGIAVHVGDVTDYAFLRRLFGEFGPDSVVHYAEQPSAPFSMMSQPHAAATVQNNLLATLNVVWAVREKAPGCHIVKLGTMGEYGTPNIDIEEGYLDVTHNGREHRFLYPKTPGSIYHLTKVQDSDLLYLAVRVWNIAVTDLNQGPVYGIETEELAADERLAPLFNYDDIFGTVLNRFVVQAVAGEPLTVYGKGGQTRGYLDIRDTLQCVALALRQPAKVGEFRVLNQFTETFSVNELANRVQRAGKAAGIKVAIRPVDNPRREAEEHYYNPKNTGLLDLGLKPHPLSDELIVGMIDFVRRHGNAIRKDYILPRVKWA
ncbi:MAG: NAD-dependent epimerase/dehydratase family protein [Rhodospirillaceae bacterium]|nr:NAD-dependent epimerase/dehydratase family protein [Rhodospirillaceae bacterium]